MGRMEFEIQLSSSQDWTQVAFLQGPATARRDPHVRHRAGHHRAQICQQDAQRLAAIVESSDDAIVSKDLKGVVTSWNSGAERIFGYTAAEMIGQPITRIIPAANSIRGDPKFSPLSRAGIESSTLRPSA